MSSPTSAFGIRGRCQLNASACSQSCPVRAHWGKLGTADYLAHLRCASIRASRALGSDLRKRASCTVHRATHLHVCGTKAQTHRPQNTCSHVRVVNSAMYEQSIFGGIRTCNRQAYSACLHFHIIVPLHSHRCDSGNAQRTRSRLQAAAV